MTRLLLWGILVITTAMLASNGLGGQEGTKEALTLVALLCALSLFVQGLLTLLS